MTFIEWSKRHQSDIVGFRVWPGIVNVVFCNTFASIREVLAGKDADALAGRVKSQLATLHNPEGLGACDAAGRTGVGRDETGRDGTGSCALYSVQ